MRSCLLPPYLLSLLLFLSWSVTARAQDGELALRIIQEHTDGREAVSNVVHVHRPMKVYIPTAFTPDGDGLNDQFEVKGEGIETLDMKVFDRWGNLIFQSDAFRKAWDGTLNGKEVDEGMYAYEVSLIGARQEQIYRRGAITLLKP